MFRLGAERYRTRGLGIAAGPLRADGTRRALTMTTEPCESITAYIYVIPNTLPVSREVQDCLPFGLKVSVTADGETVYDVTHKVNQWGGASIELKLPAPQHAGEIRQL